VGVLSVDFPGKDNADVAYRLESEYGILTRCGLHCAPDAHRAFGTFPKGTVRFSFSPATAFDEIDAAVDAIRKLS
jgi:selenocysteine lyase/cysteine desulfurase